MDFTGLVIYSGVCSAVGGALRGLLGIAKTLKENSQKPTVSQVAPGGSITDVFLKLMSYQQFGVSVLLSGAAGATLGLLSCYVFGSGVVQACSLTTLELVALGWAGIDGIESLFGTLLKKN
jgi:hypothetical protein